MRVKVHNCGKHKNPEQKERPEHQKSINHVIFRFLQSQFREYASDRNERCARLHQINKAVEAIAVSFQEGNGKESDDSDEQVVRHDHRIFYDVLQEAERFSGPRALFQAQ